MSAPLSAASQISNFKPRVAGQDYFEIFNSATGKNEIHFGPDIGWSPAIMQNVMISPTINSASWGGMSQFRLTPNLTSRVFHAVLNITVGETGGSSSVTPTFVQFFVDRLELCPNGSSTPIVVYRPEPLLWFMQNYNTDKITGLTAHNQMGIAYPDWTEGSSIAASGTRMYSFVIESSILSKLPIDFITADFVLNVYWAPTAPKVSGSGTLSLISSSLMLHSKKDTADTAVLRKLFFGKGDPYVMSFNYPVQQDFTLALVAGNQTIQLLSGVVGAFSMIQFALIASTSYASSAVYTYTPLSGDDETEYLSSLDLLDSTRNSLLGSNGALNGAMSRYRVPALHSEGVWVSDTVALYNLYATPSPSQDTRSTSGSCNGVFLLDGSQYLSITPSGTFSNGSYTVRVVFWRKSQCHLGQDGQIVQDY